MICESCRKLLPGLIDGELDLQDREDVEHHLAECSTCSLIHQRVSALRHAIRRKAKRYEAPPDMAEKLWSTALSRTIDESPSKPREKSKSKPALDDNQYTIKSVFPWRLLATVLVALVALIVVIFEISPFSSFHEETKTIDAIAALHLTSLVQNKIVQFESMERQEVDAWLSGMSAPLPPLGVLESREFPLVGSRRDDINGAMATTLVFRRETVPIGLTYLPDLPAPNQVPEYTRKGPIIAATWRQGKGSWGVASTLDESRLDGFIRLVKAATSPN